jgi:hypothetical protein
MLVAWNKAREKSLAKRAKAFFYDSGLLGKKKLFAWMG